MQPKKRQVILRGKRFVNDKAIGTEYAFRESVGLPAQIPLLDEPERLIRRAIDAVINATARTKYPLLVILIKLRITGATYETKIFVETEDENQVTYRKISTEVLPNARYPDIRDMYLAFDTVLDQMRARTPANVMVEVESIRIVAFANLVGGAQYK